MIVQHPQRTIGDRWQRCVPGVLERFTPHNAASLPTSHSALAFATNERLVIIAIPGRAARCNQLASIVLGVMLFPVATAFGGIDASLRRVLFIVLFLFPPAILSAVYSVFFEKSKFYGGLSILLITIALLVQPLAWHWLYPYLPIGCVFIIFCAVVWALRRCPNS